jgi:transposase
MPRIKGPRKVYQYSNGFRVTAVRLSYLPDVQVKDVAEELDIHPFMLSRWRKEYREGRLEAKVKKTLDPKTAAELKRLKKLERDYARLKEEHDIQKKAIRFCSERKMPSFMVHSSCGQLGEMTRDSEHDPAGGI